jgi:acetyl-CoA acetyltransferase
MSWTLRDKTCVVGVGNTAYGSFPDSNSDGLAAAALRKALDDAGLKPGQIDGVITNRIPSTERFCEMVGLETRFSVHTEMPGRFASISLMLAAQALAAGEANYIALVYGNHGRSQKMAYGGGDTLWSPWGMTSPGALHGMMWRQHMHRYGTTSEDLAHVAVAFRKHASTNPDAVMRAPITLQDHQDSRWITEPLHLLDYCLINDGGVAWIMTTPERAKDLAKPPVYVSGFARQDRFVQSSTPDPEFWYPALNAVAAQVYQRAGITRDEIDGLMIYDNFTPTVMFSLEGMGFCPRGESGRFVQGGTLELGRGRWPTNTSGGHLSESYMQGWALIAEAVRQVRGEVGGGRQIPNCNAVQYICATNQASSVIFRRQS